jgi:FlgD Ig-like domain
MKFRILVFCLLIFTFLAAEKIDIPRVSARVVSNEPDGYVGANLPNTPELTAMSKEMKAAIARGDLNTAKMIDRQMSKIRESLVPKKELTPAEFGNPQAGRVEQGSLPFLWGGDVPIYADDIWGFGTAGDTNGTMWAAIGLRPDSVIRIFRSTDHGLTWNYVQWMTHGSDFRKIEVVVGSGDSNYVYIFYIRRVADGDLWCFKLKTDLSVYNWYPVAVGPDTIDDFSVSLDYDDWYYLYCIYSNEHRTGDNSRITRSVDMGVTWETPISWGNAWDPCIAYGSGATVHVCWQYAENQSHISYQRNRSYGNPSEWTDYGQVIPDGDTVWNPVLTQSNTIPDTEAVVWCLYTHNYNNIGDWDVDYGYNTHGGAPGQWIQNNHLSWTTADEWFPDIRHYFVHPNTYVNACYNLGGYSDSTVIYWRYANASSPTAWSDPVKVNDQRATTQTDGANPKLVYSPHGPGTGSGVVFAYFGPTGLYFDAGWIGIQEQSSKPKLSAVVESKPNPFQNNTLVKYTVPVRSRVEIRVFDITGRNVKTLVNKESPAGEYSISWNGTDNTGKKQGAGIYLLKFKVNNSESVEKLILTR